MVDAKVAGAVTGLRPSALPRAGFGVACSLSIINPRAFSGRGTVGRVSLLLDLVARLFHAPEVRESCAASGGRGSGHTRSLERCKGEWGGGGGGGGDLD